MLLGKTNTPEFGLTPFTESDALGAARNPWDLSRTPGGSSGGSGAAVAARMVPIAGASDGGGSIRIPASCCGVFGLKPTRGRTPWGPDHGEVWHGLAVEHAISISVRDSAAMLDAIAGPDVGAPYDAPPHAGSFRQDAATEPGRLRIAFTAHPFLGHTTHPDCVKGLAATVDLLRHLGHEVIEAAPEIDREAFAVAFLTLVAAEARADIEQAARLAGRAVAFGDFEVGTYAVGLHRPLDEGHRLCEGDEGAAGHGPRHRPLLRDRATCSSRRRWRLRRFRLARSRPAAASSRSSS